jgi:hypothetical protein
MMHAMKNKAVWLGLAALAIVAAQPASALSLQDLRGPDGGPRFADPDEASPFGNFSVNGARVNAGGDEAGGAVWVPPRTRSDERFNPHVTTPPAYGEGATPEPNRNVR